MHDRSRRATHPSTTEATLPAAQPGKQTQLSQRPFTGAPAAATPGTRAPLTAIDPATIGSGPGMPVPGAAPVDDGQGCMWILRNDHKFECISAPPLATDKLHSEIDRDAQPDQWQSLFDRSPVHALGGGGGSSAAVQARGGAVGGADPLQTAANGVASASDALPYAGQIQAAFGRHDIGSVRAAVGGPAQKASQALGASAYATGDRVAFAGAPDLHTAAHEAAHVVQQRSGVSLAGGVGRSGDAYEQHADRVADLVVSGKSAESALDEMAGGGSPTKAVQRHDSPNHIEIGDSVSGEGITILTVVFSQGEAAALVDYVGPLAAFATLCAKQEAAEKKKGETVGRLQAMRTMLKEGNEDAKEWDRLTNGAYSELTKKNEDHFAPDDDTEAPNHSDSFVGWLADALEANAEGDAETGRMHLYTAEHYLQDMFSSGHLLAQPDIDVAIDNLLTNDKQVLAMMPRIADSVYALGAETVHCYGIEVPPLAPVPLNRVTFNVFACAAMAVENTGNKLVKSTLRKYVHEQLDAGVEVTSPAHPTPWIMQGDHKLSTDAQKETVAACQQAIADTRDLFDANATAPVEDAIGRAQSLLAHHKPVPTPGSGEKTIAQAIKSGTATNLLFMNAMVEAGVATLAGALDSACGMPMLHGVLVRITNPNENLGPADDVPDLDRGTRDPDERFVPEDRPSYIDSRPSNHASAVQLEEGVDPDPDRDRDDDVDRDKDTDESLVISDAVKGFSALGKVVEAAARNQGDSMDLSCVIRLPVPWTGTAIWVVGGFKASAVHGADGYELSMGGNLGLAGSPSAGVFLSLGTNITLTGKATDAPRAAEMLSFCLESYIRSFGTLPGAGLASAALADAIFGKGHVYKAIEGLEETASFSATKGATGGVRARDPETGLEIKLHGGVAQQNEVTSDGEDGKNEVSNRFRFEGEVAVGPATVTATFDVPAKAGDKTGTFTLAAKGLFEVKDARTWVASLAGAIGTGTSAVVRGVATQVRSSPDASAFVSGLTSLAGTLQASVMHVLADAALTLPGAGGKSKAGFEAVLEANQATGQVTLTVSTVIESAVEEEITGNKIEAARKSIALGPIVLASLK